MSLLGRATKRSATRLVAVLAAGVTVLALSAAPGQAAPTDQEALAAGGAPTTMTVGAAQVTEAAKDLVQKIDDIDKQLTADTTAAGRAAIETVRTEIAAGRITVHLPTGVSLAGADAEVFRTEAGTRMVFVPYAGAAVRPSGLTVAIDAEGAVVQTVEAVYQARSADSGTVAVWADGVLKKHELFDASGAVAPATGAAPGASDGKALQRSFWNELMYCLTHIMALPNWVISAVASVCAILCYVVVGCLPCLVGVAVGFYSELSYCVGWAAARSAS
jgi:hypothetical protein